MGKMTGNAFFVKALQEEGVEKIFASPNELLSLSTAKRRTNPNIVIQIRFLAL